jgi:hypothetical protein
MSLALPCELSFAITHVDLSGQACLYGNAAASLFEWWRSLA